MACLKKYFYFTLNKFLNAINIFFFSVFFFIKYWVYVKPRKEISTNDFHICFPARTSSIHRMDCRTLCEDWNLCQLVPLKVAFTQARFSIEQGIRCVSLFFFNGMNVSEGFVRRVVCVEKTITESYNYLYL